MPAKYRIDTSLGVVFTTGEGVVTKQEILAHGQRLREDPDFDPNYNQIIDVRKAMKIEVSAGELPAIAKLENIFSEHSLRAIVAESDLKFGMGRMIEGYSESSDGQIAVFRDMEEARRWLGLDQAQDSN